MTSAPIHINPWGVTLFEPPAHGLRSCAFSEDPYSPNHVISSELYEASATPASCQGWKFLMARNKPFLDCDFNTIPLRTRLLLLLRGFIKLPSRNCFLSGHPNFTLSFVPVARASSRSGIWLRLGLYGPSLEIFDWEIYEILSITASSLSSIPSESRSTGPKGAT